MTSITVNVDETQWNFALNKANTQAQTLHNNANKSKPAASQTAFVPATLATFVQNRINDLTTNYANQAAASVNSVLLAADAATKQRIAKVLSAPDAVKAQFAAQVDALLVPAATPTPVPVVAATPVVPAAPAPVVAPAPVAVAPTPAAS